jgi:DNA-binding NarL/FixJ family response regulator
MLAEEPSFEVVGQAENGKAAVSMAQQLQPDIIVMDVAMPELNGIEATRQITKQCPKTKVVALSIHSNKRLVLGILQAGASAYLIKTSEFEEVAKAIHAVSNNRVYLSPEIAGTVLEQIPGRHPEPNASGAAPELTPREREVLQLLAEGKTPREIAQSLFVSLKTVETHRRSIKRKLNARTLADLTKYAIQEGLTSPEV